MLFDRRLWQFTTGVRLRIAWATLIGLVSAAVGIARLALLGWVLAKVFRGEPFASLVLPFAAIAAVMVLRGALEYWRDMAAHHTAAKIQIHLRELLFAKIIALGPAHFGTQRTGNIALFMVDGVEQLETFFGRYLPQLMVAALTPIGIFAFVAFLDLPVATVLLGFALFTLLGPLVFQSWDIRNSRRREKAYGSFGAEFLDAVQGLATLKAFGQSAARIQFLAKKARDVFRATMWVFATNAMARGITDTGIAVGAAATLGYGAYRTSAGEMSLEALLIVLMMGIEVFRPLRVIRNLIHQGMNGRAAAMGIMGILDAQPILGDEIESAESVDGLAPSVSFENVGFTYPGAQRMAHDGLSFEIGEGERVGIVGSSGAGKSSVVRLLLRLYDPQQGCVRIGGKDLRSLDIEGVRGRMAVVNQDTYLFHGTVEDNLRFGKADATQDELEEAARAANAHEFIASLPRGYRTVVGERGIKLSGGQRQRIAIARALLRDAPILVLDEALSSVDAENEGVIQKALDRLMEGRTTLIFAHRLSSVIGADRIIVLDEGRVAEEGSHATLMANRGRYHTLMSGQIEDSQAAEAIFFDRKEDGSAAPAVDIGGLDEAAQMEPTDAILRAEGLGWFGASAVLGSLVAPFKGRLTLTFFLGVARVCSMIGVGVLSGLIVAAIKADTPYEGLVVALAVTAPLAGVLHWLESWVAHDMAYRLLAEIRISLFEKLDKLAPAYLLRRRTGDLVGMATQDVETVEFFFAHTIAPAFVAVLVPGIVLATLMVYGWLMALALFPFLAIVGLSPFVMRRRIDALGARSRESLGELNAHSVDTIQGLSEIVAFQQAEPRGALFGQLSRHHHRTRLKFFRDLSAQTALLEVATGLGGLAVVVAGARLDAAGALEAGILPLLSLLAMAAFLPVSEIANIGRQLADTLGSTRRLYAVHGEVPTVTDGPGAEPIKDSPVALEMEGVDFAYHGANRLALSGASVAVPRGTTMALVGPSGAGKTTAAHLLMRFWDPADGVVRMDGRDIREYRIDDLRRRIALVAQDTFLFNDTLAANIRIARPDATDSEVHDALSRAALDDFVAMMPLGLDSPWESAACNCRAVSASVSRSRGLSSRTRRC